MAFIERWPLEKGYRKRFPKKRWQLIQLLLMLLHGPRVNRGAGYGLEIPGKFHFFGPEPYIDKFEKLAAEFKDKILL